MYTHVHMLSGQVKCNKRTPIPNHTNNIYIYIAKSGMGVIHTQNYQQFHNFPHTKTIPKDRITSSPQCIHPHACRSRHPVLGVRANDIHGVNFGILMGRTSPLTPEEKTII